ncbi:hypothetical protein A9179_20110 [Pseudomonas alcaligenes]|uniref:Uncharacterized protein n=2 Tax=Aquipseudomonas alcaligenes TaxID=43263 RepID=A0ABR7S4S4_AQUAC|nr:hypothetical protein [Pseudomonas alcaligenes]
MDWYFINAEARLCWGASIMLIANSFEELAVKLAVMEVGVPARSERRQSHHVERYCIAHLLSTLPTTSLAFPLILVHRDKPDFHLSMSDSSIGVEHTEAVPVNFARGQAMRESGLGPDIYFTPHFKPGEARKAAEILRSDIEADLPGEGWCGDSPEREWASAMAYHAAEKLPKVVEGGFERYPSNWLLIYDNWPLPAVDYVAAASYLAPLLVQMEAFSIFDKVFIHDESWLCELSEAGVAIHKLVKPCSLGRA